VADLIPTGRWLMLARVDAVLSATFQMRLVTNDPVTLPPATESFCRTVLPWTRLLRSMRSFTVRKIVHVRGSVNFQCNRVGNLV
jgi:hypothetical protein